MVDGALRYRRQEGVLHNGQRYVAVVREGHIDLGYIRDRRRPRIRVEAWRRPDEDGAERPVKMFHVKHS